jgi:hypothetical protein
MIAAQAGGQGYFFFDDPKKYGTSGAGPLTSSLNPIVSLKDSDGSTREATELAVELARQVYGDTRSRSSAADTSSPQGSVETMKRVEPLAPKRP